MSAGRVDGVIAWRSRRADRRQTDRLARRAALSASASPRRARRGVVAPSDASSLRRRGGRARPRASIARGSGRGRPRPGRGGEHARRASRRLEHLEVAPLDDRRLVDVAAEDQLGARVGEPREHAASAPRAGASRAATARPASWWWSTTTRSAPGARAASCASARSSSCGADAARAGSPSGWTELSPTTSQRRRGVDAGVVVSHCRSNSRQGRVSRAGRTGRDVVVPGTTSSGGPRPAGSAPPPRARRGGPRWVRSPLATTSSGATRSTSSPIARSSAGSSSPFRAPKWRSDTWRMHDDTVEAGYSERYEERVRRTRSSTISISASAPAARCARSGAASC